MDLQAFRQNAQPIVAIPRLADLAYINSERAASGETPAMMDFLVRWMEAHDFKMAIACYDLLREKKCPSPEQKKNLTEDERKGLLRKDRETPSIVHELSQALYTISLVEGGFKLPDVETLLCLNFLHDLGEENDVTTDLLRQHLRKAGIPDSPRVTQLCDLFENMTKSRYGHPLYIDNYAYFLTMLDDPTTVIAKFQDRIHNMATLINVIKFDKHKDYIVETIELRNTLNKAKTLYPDYTDVFETLNKIVSAQISFNASFLNKQRPDDPVVFNFGVMPRLSRINQLPLGLDPLHILQTRANIHRAKSVYSTAPAV